MDKVGVSQAQCLKSGFDLGELKSCCLKCVSREVKDQKRTVNIPWNSLMVKLLLWFFGKSNSTEYSEHSTTCPFTDMNGQRTDVCMRYLL